MVFDCADCRQNYQLFGTFVFLIPTKFKMQDNPLELLPVVDPQGNVVGSAHRGQLHDGSKILHPVVHLHVFNPAGELYLQKRPMWKDIQPGRWDTAVGGHIAYGEAQKDALVREAWEEIGITGFEPVKIRQYVFESSVERELVYVFKTVYDKPLAPSRETDGGRFWSVEEIKKVLGGKILTENLESEVTNILCL